MLVSASKLSLPRGFSLVELVVVVAILGIVASIALPSYRVFILNTQIRTVGESIVNGMQIARGEAIRRNTDVRFEMLDGSAWQVCIGAVEECDEPVQKRETRDGSSDLIVVTVTPAEDTTLVFNPLGSLRNPPPESILISGADGTRMLQVNVGVSGSTRLCDPAASEDDPRGCN